jgi:DNA-binding response OmpR family regulator
MRENGSQKKRILIVEDEVSIGNFCRRVLCSAGFEADVATDGEKARQMIQCKDYDLFLVDLRLPILNGRELYNWLKITYPQSAARVIFMTGSIASETTDEFLKSSSRPVLLKPFTLAEMELMVKQALGRIEGSQQVE